MFKKIKFLLVCAIVAIGATGCTSDDNSSLDVKEPLATYTLGVSVTKGSSILQVKAIYQDASGSLEIQKEDKFTGTTWSKDYKEKKGKKLSFTVDGLGSLEDPSEMTVKVIKDNKVIKEASSTDNLLSVTITM